MQYVRTALIALATCAALPTAWAETCGNTSFTAQTAGDCRGSFVGSLSGAAAETSLLASTWGGSWSYAGKTDDAANGPFSTNPQAAFGGVLGFDLPLSGDFVVGLEAAGQYSFYLFRGTAGVASLTYDSTEGVATSIQGNPVDLTRAALYVTAVPEPGMLALWLAGLAAMGLRARRGKAA